MQNLGGGSEAGGGGGGGAQTRCIMGDVQWRMEY